MKYAKEKKINERYELVFFICQLGSIYIFWYKKITVISSILSVRLSLYSILGLIFFYFSAINQSVLFWTMPHLIYSYTVLRTRSRNAIRVWLWNWFSLLIDFWKCFNLEHFSFFHSHLQYFNRSKTSKEIVSTLLLTIVHF
jgi:hypothetical protein